MTTHLESNCRIAKYFGIKMPKQLQKSKLFENRVEPIVESESSPKSFQPPLLMNNGNGFEENENMGKWDFTSLFY